MKKVIITGVSGQTGSYMADYLLRLGEYKVFGILRRSANPDLSNLEKSISSPNFKILTADLNDSGSLDSLVQEILPDYFINFAAQSFVGVSWKIPEQTFDTNATGVIRCLEAIRKYRPECRFYNAGSSEEFGDVVYNPQDENHPSRARSVYGASKIAARQIVKVYRESYDLYAIQGILFNHESERRGEEFVTRKISKGVAKIAHALKYDGVIPPIVLGNLDSSRDWSHAEDFVDGIWKMLNQEDIRCNLREYVLSSNETHTIREFIERAFQSAGVDILDVNPDRIEPCIGDSSRLQINYVLKENTSIPLVVVSREFYRPAEVNNLHGDSTRARTKLGWRPNVSFEELVERMVENDIKKLTGRKENV